MSYTWTNGEVITAEKLNSTGGYDAEVSIYGDSNGAELTIISGSYASLSALLNENIHPNVLVRVWFENYGGNYAKTASTAVTLYAYEPNASEKYIIFGIKIPTSDSGGAYSTEWKRYSFEWNENDELSL